MINIQSADSVRILIGAVHELTRISNGMGSRNLPESLTSWSTHTAYRLRLVIDKAVEDLEERAGLESPNDTK